MPQEKNNTDSNVLIKEQFGREAAKYVSSRIHSSKNDLEEVIELLQSAGLNSAWIALDIATGAGHLALTIAPFVSKIIASDLTQEMLDQAERLRLDRKLLNVETQLIDVHENPYSDETFDLITSRIAAHHFYNISLAVQEMVRVLKPGGRIFIQDTISPVDSEAADFINHLERLRDPSHIRSLSPTEWITLLEQNGCKIFDTYTRRKKWPLQWWMNRMSTPPDSQDTIRELLDENYQKYHEYIEIERLQTEDSIEWTIYPLNGYFLAVKR
ncbi:MAG: class I SAM-dependent methyltransferase [Candidatus Hodarchaeales archaeon]